MAQTDSPLKDLVESNITDFAVWLLKTEVIAVDALNVEFPGQDARIDPDGQSYNDTPQSC